MLTSADGSRAWELFQTHGPDVVVLDWLMPGMTRIELCRKIRAHPALYTYVLIVTSQRSRVSGRVTALRVEVPAACGRTSRFPNFAGQGARSVESAP